MAIDVGHGPGIACSVEGVEDFKTQMFLWGHAYTGKSPRDRIVLWCEDRIGWVEDTYAMWDHTEAYFRGAQVNGGRPAWWHALLPAVVGGLDPFRAPGARSIEPNRSET